MPCFHIKCLYAIFASDDYFLEIENKSHIIALIFHPFSCELADISLCQYVFTMPHCNWIYAITKQQWPSSQSACRESYLQFMFKQKSAALNEWMSAYASKRPHKNDKIRIESKTTYVNLATQPIEQLAHHENDTDKKWYGERRRRRHHRRHNWDKYVYNLFRWHIYFTVFVTSLICIDRSI